MLAEGKTIREKTYAEENLEELEQKVTEYYHKNKLVDTQHQNVTDLRNKAALQNEALANKEKLAGDFKLRINRNLQMHQKIEKYSQDSVVFFLHKKRNFIEKIHRQEQEDDLRKQADEEKQRLIEQEGSPMSGRLRKATKRSMVRQR